MTNFLVLYRADVSAAEQMANATPEQQQAGMQAWMDWFAKAGDAVVDGGSPVSGDDKSIGGYSVLQAKSRDALDAILENHPHTQIGTIEVLECLTMPGM
ncbi:YciI family protein [Amycolatopsis sp. GM8]|uniref:YciI family protein n=1 Tax=Amycolatopsis sp. GM8 TaxID=2896530 RepID=UPI001F49299F|nr:YciI family protein [Amycolatopsis sp. GM8]